MSLLTTSIGSAGNLKGGASVASVLAVAISLALLTALGGCSGMSRALGGGKRPPDEFTVVGRAPLVVPPDYNLMPPKDAKPDEQRKADVDPRKMAMEALFPAGRTDVPAAHGAMPAVPASPVSGSSLAPVKP
jgi:hypothetical protein